MNSTASGPITVDDELQQAIDCLTIRDVYLRKSSAALMDDFEPKYDADTENLAVQFKHIVTQSNVLELEDDSGERTHLFRVFVDLGTRWVMPETEDAESPDVKAFIEGTMVAEYQLDGEPGPEALKKFAMKNASYHIWPFWREYLSSQCVRMNLPKLVMPIKQFAANQNN